MDVARLRIKARAAGLVDVAVQGPNIRFGPVQLPESRQMRLQRMYPGSKYLAVPNTQRHVALVPKPKTARIGGKDLVDAAILDWANEVIKAVLQDTATGV